MPIEQNVRAVTERSEVAGRHAPLVLRVILEPTAWQHQHHLVAGLGGRRLEVKESGLKRTRDAHFWPKPQRQAVALAVARLGLGPWRLPNVPAVRLERTAPATPGEEADAPLAAASMTRLSLKLSKASKNARASARSASLARSPPTRVLTSKMQNTRVVGEQRAERLSVRRREVRVAVAARAVLLHSRPD
eukprot:6085180-Prymnesium_polylepis.2